VDTSNLKISKSSSNQLKCLLAAKFQWTCVINSHALWMSLKWYLARALDFYSSVVIHLPIYSHWHSDGYGSNFCSSGWVRSTDSMIFCLMQVRIRRKIIGLGQPSMVWVWVWKISPKNVKFFSLRVKKKSLWGGSKASRPLIYCKSKVSSGQVSSGPISRLTQNILLFMTTVEMQNLC